jgi:hypothetical protein
MSIDSQPGQMSTDATRPPAVRRASICLWISAGLALLVTAAEVTGLAQVPGGTVVNGLTGVLTAAVFALLAAKINSGRNWARWTYVFIYVIGALGLVFVLKPALLQALPAIIQANMVVQTALQTAALVLIFTRPARQWFKAVKH